MGCEIGQSDEWNANGEVDWWLLKEGPYHKGLQAFVQELNKVYLSTPALWYSDFDQEGFQWIDCSDQESSVLSFSRHAKSARSDVVVILNLTPVSRYPYRVGFPRGGKWREAINSDSEKYGGSNVGNLGGIVAKEIPCHGRPFSAELILPPLSLSAFIAE